MPVYQGQEYCTLPHVQMTPERIEQVSSIMRLGNLELKRLHQELLDANELGPKEYIRADFRKELFAWLASMNGQVSCRLKRRKGGKTYSPLLFVPSKTNNPYDTFTVVDGHRQPVQKARGVNVSSRAMRRILAIKAIQEEVLQGFSRLFERLAIRFWLNHKELSLGIQDYYDEGVMAAINAIYHYTRDDVEFITYVYHCVRRKMGSGHRTRQSVEPLVQRGPTSFTVFTRKQGSRLTNRPPSKKFAITASSPMPKCGWWK